MDIDYIYARTILFENSVVSSAFAAKKMLAGCAAKCQRSSKKGPDYDYTVKVCTSSCKINGYSKLISSMSSMRGGAIQPQVLNKKISYFQKQIKLEKVKYAKYREQLKARQRKIPVAQSLKPSPERWNPTKLN
jgi:hypothetical protein